MSNNCFVTSEVNINNFGKNEHKFLAHTYTLIIELHHAARRYLVSLFWNTVKALLFLFLAPTHSRNIELCGIFAIHFGAALNVIMMYNCYR